MLVFPIVVLSVLAVAQALACGLFFAASNPRNDFGLKFLFGFFALVCELVAIILLAAQL